MNGLAHRHQQQVQSVRQHLVFCFQVLLLSSYGLLVQGFSMGGSLYSNNATLSSASVWEQEHGHGFSPVHFSSLKHHYVNSFLHLSALCSGQQFSGQSLEFQCADLDSADGKTVCKTLTILDCYQHPGWGKQVALGSGAFGQVSTWKQKFGENPQTVAVKFVESPPIQNEKTVPIEMRALYDVQALRCPYIVTYYGGFETSLLGGATWWLVFGRVVGASASSKAEELFHLVNKRFSTTEKEEKTKKQALYRALISLAAIHNKGIAHNDVKLENFLTESSLGAAEGGDASEYMLGAVVLIDFGSVSPRSPSARAADDFPRARTMRFAAPDSEAVEKGKKWQDRRWADDWSKLDMWSYGVDSVLFVQYRQTRLFGVDLICGSFGVDSIYGVGADSTFWGRLDMW